MDAVQEFERRAHDFNGPLRASAEEYFLNLRKDPASRMLCRQVIEQSSEQFALFHAVQAYRDMVLNEWTLMPEGDRAELRTYLLTYVVNNVNNLDFFVTNQFLSTVAVFVKRGWLHDQPIDRATLFDQIKTLCGLDGDKKLVAVELMRQLCCEFSSFSKATRIGLPWEFHNECRVSFERGELRNLFVNALEILALPPDPALAELLGRTLSLVSEILSWEFSDHKNQSIGSFVSAAERTGTVTILKPGPEWQDLLLGDSLCNLLMHLYGAMKEDAILAGHIRQSLVRLCSLAGSVFVDPAARGAYLQMMINVVSHIMNNPMEPNPADSTHHLREILDVCDCIHTLSTNFGLRLFLTVSNLHEFLSGMTQLTINLLRATARADASVDVSWQNDSYDHVQTAWVTLLSNVASGEPVTEFSGKESSGAEVCSWFQPYTTQIYEAFIEVRMTRAEEVLWEGGEDEDNDDQLSAMAQLGRVAPLTSLSLLCGVLEAKTRERQQDNPEARNHVLSEQTQILIHLLGYLLTDEVDGEEAAIPAAMLAITPETKDHPVITASLLVFQVMEYETALLTNGVRDSRLSPSLGASLMWFAKRWTLSYLFPKATQYGSLIHPSFNDAYGRDGGGAGLVEVFLNKIACNLMLWESEEEVMSSTCKLLLALSKSNAIVEAACNSNVLVSLVEAVGNQADGLGRLIPATRKLVILGLCSLARGMGDGDMRANYLNSIIGPIREKLAVLISIPGFVVRSQEVEMVERSLSIIEMFHGLAMIRQPSIVPGIFDVVAEHFGTLIEFLNLYNTRAEVIHAVVNIFVDTAENQIAFLNQSQTPVFCSACLQLLQIFARVHQGFRTTAEAGAETQNEDDMLDVSLLVSLLRNLVCKDFLDFGEDNDPSTAEVRITGQRGGLEIGEVVFAGISMVIDIITPEMLQVPELCRPYMALINFMMEVYPNKAAELPPALFERLIKTIEFGIEHAETNINKTSLEALGGLVSFHHEHGGLANQLEANPMIFRYYLRLIFELMVLREFNMDLMDPASEVLFGLLCVQHDQFLEMVRELVEAQPGEELQMRLNNAFNTLLSANDLQPTPSVRMRRLFKTNLLHFLVSVRGFLCRL